MNTLSEEIWKMIEKRNMTLSESLKEITKVEKQIIADMINDIKEK